MISAPQLIDSRYRLGQLVGRGGMSAVYRAEDAATGGEVAVKIVRSGEPLVAERMAREARALQALDHPNLVRLLGSGTLGDEAYLVMEFVEGPTLADRIHGGPMDPAEVDWVAAGVASALAYVHEAGVVHRDVKPANVLLGTDGRVRLGDFGIARLAGAETLTLAGTTLGTVAYMAPEQLHNHRVGPPADVWSLGIVLLESLTGRRWYEGSPTQIIARRLREPVSLPEGLPGRWGPLLVAMLAESPAERITAADLQHRLGGVTAPAAAASPWGAPAGGWPTPGPALPATLVHHDPYVETAVDETPPAPAARPPRPDRRRRMWLAAAALIAAIAIVLILVLGASSQPRPGASAPPTSTAIPPGVSSELAAITSTVRSGEAAGTVATSAGTALVSLASQAVTQAGAGHTDLASSDLHQAATMVADGPTQHTFVDGAATALQADLVVLAQQLGLGGAATVPSAVPSTTAPPPTPPAPHKKKGGDGGGGDQGRHGG